MQKIITKNRTASDGTQCQAVFSEDMQYRYMLSRIWSPEPTAIFIMLNPSIGDENYLEPTTAGVRTRAKKWGYGGILVFNLFAVIATDPKKLYDHPDPVGEHNDHFIKMINELTALAGSTVVCAWGNHGNLKNRDVEVLDQLYVPLYVLDLNKGGQPKHPLHMSHSITPRIWQSGA